MLIQVERWATFYPDCLPLFNEHNDEIGEDAKRMPLDPDVETFAAMDRLNALQIVTARSKMYDVLLGYCLFTVGNSLQSKSILCGTQSLFFLTKKERPSGAGLGMYREAIKQLKERGVKNIYPHHYLKGDSIRLGAYFEKLGAHELMHEYSLWIGR